ncbi:MAG: alpha/beta hydrolase [Candidatus Hodarchaeales archaeon]
MKRKYIKGAEPLFLEGKDKGLLLLHGGGGGTTWDLKEFARVANESGFTVWLPSLPGYGTVPEELNSVQFGDWLATAIEGVERLRESCTSVFAIGHSLGGLIALVLAAETGVDLDRVVTWAAAWNVRNRMLKFLPLISRVPGLRGLIPERIPVNIPDRFIDMGWIGYDWLPGSLGFALYEGIKRLHSAVTKVSCPVLVIQGTNDEAVTADSAEQIFKRLSSPLKELWLIENATHPLMQDFCKDELFKRTLSYLVVEQ